MSNGRLTVKEKVDAKAIGRITAFWLTANVPSPRLVEEKMVLVFMPWHSFPVLAEGMDRVFAAHGEERGLRIWMVGACYGRMLASHAMRRMANGAVN